MAEFPAKAISATPVGASRPEGADAAATVELLDPASSSSSKTRSSNVNEESVEAGVPHVNANNAICQAPTVEDDELRSQSSGVCPQGAWTDAGSVEHRPEEGVRRASALATCRGGLTPSPTCSTIPCQWILPICTALYSHWVKILLV